MATTSAGTIEAFIVCPSPCSVVTGTFCHRRRVDAMTNCGLLAFGELTVLYSLMIWLEPLTAGEG
jgi:hypothetical protein